MKQKISFISLIFVSMFAFLVSIKAASSLKLEASKGEVNVNDVFTVKASLEGYSGSLDVTLNSFSQP